MFVRQSEELNSLGPEELGKDEKRFVGMLSGESEARGSRLTARPVRSVQPYDPIPLAVDAKGAAIQFDEPIFTNDFPVICLLYTSPSPRDYAASRMPSSA